jgi:hypothetical protein
MTNTTKNPDTNNPTRTRRLRRGGTALAIAVASVIGISTVAPAAHAEGTPKYRIQALSFKATDESNVDWLGSDEPYWIFSGVTGDGTSTTRRSKVFSDVDSGETKTFSGNDGCILYPTSTSCSGVPGPDGIGMTVQLWEKDNGDMSRVLSTINGVVKTTAPVLHALGVLPWDAKTTQQVTAATDKLSSLLEDDLLGSDTVGWSASTLASKLRFAGASFTETKYFGGAKTSGGADYYLTYRVTRVS